jgi:RsiW-degrading membrane proteinase PrsW (M82 family)
MKLLLIALAPVFILLAYVYYRDKYDKEPLGLLIKGLIAGMLITIPVLFAEQGMSRVILPLQEHVMANAFGTAFLVAALCEEALKYLAVFLLVWRNKAFNERFDGIVYAVFVSLGFALIENLLYVFGNDNGLSVGIGRAFTAVPAHAVFGILMGYHLGLAKFSQASTAKHLANAFFFPFLFHGLYDFILMSGHPALLVTFVPLLIYMFYRANKRMKQLSAISVFNPDNQKKKHAPRD